MCVVKLKKHAVGNLLISSAYTSLKPTIKCKEPIQILFLWLNASVNAHNCSVKRRLDDVYHDLGYEILWLFTLKIKHKLILVLQ